MKSLNVPIIIAIAFIACGCNSTISRKLNDIESYIQERPDSALTVLGNIDSTQVKTKPQKALYSLLTAMAQDKNDILTTDQKIIEPAVMWYGKHRQDDRYTAALFYSGRIKFCTGDYPSAILFFQQAKNEAGSIYWKAMATSHMGITFNHCYNNEEELKYNLEAYELWKESRDPYKIQQAALSLATAYSNNRLFNEADSLLCLLCSSDQPFFPAFRQRAELKIKRDNPDYPEIVSLFNTSLNNGCAMSLDNWYEYAYALFKSGETARSADIIRQLSNYDESISSCLWLGKIAEESGDFELALHYERTEKQLTDAIVKTQLSQSLFKAQAEQYKLISEMESQKRATAILFAILLSIISAGALLAIVQTYKVRHKRLEIEKERAYSIAEKASEMLRQTQEDLEKAEAISIDTQNKLAELRRTYAKMYQNQFTEIGHLYDYCNSDIAISEKATKQHLKKINEIISEINRGDKHQREFESRINQDLDNIMQKLRHDFPDFKESDFRFLSYVIVGFDATTRAIILNETPNNMRVKKARLIKKIANSQTDNSLLYSCFLHPDR